MNNIIQGLKERWYIVLVVLLLGGLVAYEKEIDVEVEVVVEEDTEVLKRLLRIVEMQEIDFRSYSYDVALGDIEMEYWFKRDKGNKIRVKIKGHEMELSAYEKERLEKAFSDSIGGKAGYEKRLRDIVIDQTNIEHKEVIR